MAERITLWTVTDPRGLNITLTDDVWQDILNKHREMNGQLELAKKAAQDPDEIYFDPETTAQRASAKIYLYYKMIRSLPNRKFAVVVVKVVIEDGNDSGYVQSAWTPRRIQSRLVREWKK